MTVERGGPKTERERAIKRYVWIASFTLILLSTTVLFFLPTNSVVAWLIKLFLCVSIIASSIFIGLAQDPDPERLVARTFKEKDHIGITVSCGWAIIARLGKDRKRRKIRLLLDAIRALESACLLQRESALPITFTTAMLSQDTRRKYGFETRTGMLDLIAPISYWFDVGLGAIAVAFFTGGHLYVAHRYYVDRRHFLEALHRNP
jgi:hypothetical protein